MVNILFNNPKPTPLKRMTNLELYWLVNELQNEIIEFRNRIKTLEKAMEIEKKEAEDRDLWLEVEDDVAIEKISYNAQGLQVKFTGNEKVYTYLSVPPELFMLMMKAPSKIRFLNTQIKDKFRVSSV